MSAPTGWLECNRECDCWPIEPGRVADALPVAVRKHLDKRHAHLFAETGVFLHQQDLQSMTEQIEAIESVSEREDYQALTLGKAASYEPQQKLRGALMGYDFHLSAHGPKLIEINTNAGGAFLVQHMQNALELRPSFNRDSAQEFLDMFASEWSLSERTGRPVSIAVVDEDPESEYLYSDMQLAAELLRRRFNRVFVVSSRELRFSQGALRLRSGEVIDMVYNRLTDFLLAEQSSAPIYEAWRSDAVVVTPSPRQHALLANKLNLPLLADATRWSKTSVSKKHLAALAKLPAATRLTADNAQDLWQRRKQLFFKPAAGYAGRAAYRGAKLTRKVWAQLLANLDAQPYVAQELVLPANRLRPDTEARLGASDGARLLKFDVRVFSYAAKPLLLAARVYEGQTTNFRTPGGGFAPVAVVDGDWNDS